MYVQKAFGVNLSQINEKRVTKSWINLKRLLSCSNASVRFCCPKLIFGIKQLSKVGLL